MSTMSAYIAHLLWYIDKKAKEMHNELDITASQNNFIRIIYKDHHLLSSVTLEMLDSQSELLDAIVQNIMEECTYLIQKVDAAQIRFIDQCKAAEPLRLEDFL